jgi:hypothetical protein
MTDSRGVVDRIVARLRADAGARAMAVRFGVEASLAQPVRALVDREAIVRIVGAAVTEANVARVLREHVRPGVERHRARAAASGETIGAGLPDGAGEAIDALLAEVRLPEAAWATDVIDAGLVRELLSPVVQHTLVAFAKKLPLVGLGDDGGGGILGGIARGIRKGVEASGSKVVDVGKSVLGGQIEKRIAPIARDFAESAADEVRDALAERLRSEEGRVILGKLRAHALDRLGPVKVADVLADADGVVPHERLEAVIASVASHNATRAFVADAVRAEVGAFLAVAGDRTVGELLAEAGLRDVVVEEAVARGEMVFAALVAQDAFAIWLGVLAAE